MALPDWWSRVKGVMDGRGIPVRVWLPILWAESSGNPTARNLGSPGHPEDSVGLFALNRLGGQGSGMSVSYLQDPVNNASIAANSFAVANAICARKGQSNDLTCIAINSGHPTETGVIPAGNQLVINILAAGHAIGNASSDAASWDAVAKSKPGDPSTVPGGGGSSSGASSWSDWLDQIGNLIRGGHQGDPSVSPADPTVAGQETVLWNVVFSVAGVGLVWLGLSGLVAPGVGLAANVTAPFAPGAAAVGTVASGIGGATRAIGGAGAAIGRTTVSAIDTAVPKHGGRQAVRVKGRPGAVRRGLPQPPLR